jgi:4-hydroxybenzoate polyprenyltransferase
MLSIVFMSVGLYGFGMSLNDIIDHRRDRQISPNRPLPSGRIGLRGAHVIAAGLITLALAAGISYSFNDVGDPMSLILVIWTAMLIAFYDFAGKYLVWPGLVTLGLIRMFHAAIPAPNLPLVWQPMWLLNHVCILSAVAYQWEEKRPTLKSKHWWGIISSLIVIDALLLLVVWWRRRFDGSGHERSFVEVFWIQRGLILPVAAAAVFLLLAILIRRTSPTLRDAGQRLMLYGLLWLIVYDTAFVAGYVGTMSALMIFLLLPIAFGCVKLMRWWSKVISLSQRPEFKRAGA